MELQIPFIPTSFSDEREKDYSAVPVMSNTNKCILNFYKG